MKRLNSGILGEGDGVAMSFQDRCSRRLLVDGPEMTRSWRSGGNGTVRDSSTLRRVSRRRF